MDEDVSSRIEIDRLNDERAIDINQDELQYEDVESEKMNSIALIDVNQVTTTVAMEIEINEQSSTSNMTTNPLEQVSVQEIVQINVVEPMDVDTDKTNEIIPDVEEKNDSELHLQGENIRNGDADVSINDDQVTNDRNDLKHEADKNKDIDYDKDVRDGENFEVDMENNSIVDATGDTGYDHEKESAAAMLAQLGSDIHQQPRIQNDTMDIDRNIDMPINDTNEFYTTETNEQGQNDLDEKLDTPITDKNHVNENLDVQERIENHINEQMDGQLERNNEVKKQIDGQNDNETQEDKDFSPIHKKQKTHDEKSASVTLDVQKPMMLSRDEMAKMEEDNGGLQFLVIQNDGEPQHMMQLMRLKNIFARQLPKMPKEYIVRLVFNRHHRSMIIVKNNSTVIGGISYRPFEENHVAEIAFCAINASDQVKGYGTRLMNHLKEYVKTHGEITHFLTYADNYAIGYFKKQGFTKDVSLDRRKWLGYIKDYDGGTLMECKIHKEINYLKIPMMVQMQRRALLNAISARSKAHVIYDGLKHFPEKRRVDIYTIPGIKEAGWSPAVVKNHRVGSRDQDNLASQLQQIVKMVHHHRSAWPFHEPVDTTVVVDYLDHIKDPIDLVLIQKRVDTGQYLSKDAIKKDLIQMCKNCLYYNAQDTNYYKAAEDLLKFINKRLEN